MLPASRIGLLPSWPSISHLHVLMRHVYLCTPLSVALDDPTSIQLCSSLTYQLCIVNTSLYICLMENIHKSLRSFFYTIVVVATTQLSQSP
jgi:hypothetical protein